MSHKMRCLAALVLGAIVSSGSARAWVAVRVAPRVVGAAAVGVAAGAVAGAAVASSQPTTVVTTPPPTYYAPPPPSPPPSSAPAPSTAPQGTTSSSSASQSGSKSGRTPVGNVVTTLPSDCVSTGGRYQCGSTWYQPYFGANGVYYEAVAP